MARRLRARIPVSKQRRFVRRPIPLARQRGTVACRKSTATMFPLARLSRACLRPESVRTAPFLVIADANFRARAADPGLASLVTLLAQNRWNDERTHCP